MHGEYGEYLNKAVHYCKRHIAFHPPHNILPLFKHSYSIILATFWHSSGIALPECFPLLGVFKNGAAAAECLQRKDSLWKYYDMSSDPWFTGTGNFWILPKVKMTVKNKLVEWIQDIDTALTVQLKILTKEDVQNCFVFALNLV